VTVFLAGIPPRYVTKPTRSTQPCIPPGSSHRVPALIGWGNGGKITSAGWLVPLRDPIWDVAVRLLCLDVRINSGDDGATLRKNSKLLPGKSRDDRAHLHTHVLVSGENRPTHLDSSCFHVLER